MEKRNDNWQSDDVISEDRPTISATPKKIGRENQVQICQVLSDVILEQFENGKRPFED